MNIKLLTSSLAGAGAMLCGVAQAQFVLNYDVPGAGGWGVNYVGLGAAPDLAGDTYWNPTGGTPANYSYSGGTTGGGFGDLLSDGATYTTITLTLNAGGSYNSGGQGAQGTVGGLSAPFVFNSSGTLNNVAAGTYDLYLYGYNYPDGDRGTTFTVSAGGTSYGSQSTLGANWNQSDNTTVITSFVQGGAFNNVVSGGTPGPDAVAGSDYVEYTDITLATAGTISFTFAGNPFDRASGFSDQDYSGNNGEGDFNGLQLVQIVPEPSTMALAGLGICGLIVAMKRRRLSA